MINIIQSKEKRKKLIHPNIIINIIKKKKKTKIKKILEKIKMVKRCPLIMTRLLRVNSSTYYHEKENENFSDINKNSNNNELVLCKNKENKYCKEFKINNENEVINNRQYNNNFINKDFDNINNINVKGFRNLN